MELRREILEPLKKWAVSSQKLPVLLQGARQTGKTWVMKELGQQCFAYTAYFDFAGQPEVRQIFKNTRDPETILKDLNLISKVPIIAGKTLLILDEIQLSTTALGSLKYFAEQMPNLRVIAAANCLEAEVKRKQIFVPVGKVDIRHLDPLSFREYLMNLVPKIFKFIEELKTIEPLPEVVISELNRHFLRYQCIGGMPSAVSLYADGADMASIERELEKILSEYRADFSKYATKTECARISAVWDSIPRQVSRRNSRFFLSGISKNARTREYMLPIQWLIEAGLIAMVNQVSLPKSPLTAYQDSNIFKLYVSDIGLLRVMSLLGAERIISPGVEFSDFKGTIAENLVANSLSRLLGYSPSFWSSGATAELDFLFQHRDLIIPVEVKSGMSIAGKSLNVYRQKYSPKLAVRYSLRNLVFNSGILNIPLPMVDWTFQLLNRLR